MKIILSIILCILMVSCIAPQNPLAGVDIPEPTEPHLFHPFIKGIGSVKYSQEDKLAEAREQLELVIAEDTKIQYPEAYPYLVECYRQLGLVDSAAWIYAKAQERLSAFPVAPEKLQRDLTGWATFFPELPDSFKLPDYMVMDSGAEPMGGMRGLYSRLEYPEMAKNMNRTGVTYLSFVVKIDGSLSGLQVLVSSYPDLDAAALKAVETSTWIPAKYHGRAVPFHMIFPVHFRL